MTYLSNQDTQSDPEERIVSLTLIFVFLSISTVTIVYVLSFYHYEWGQPSDWAKFGNYFSGLLTPALAFASVLILCRTLVSNQQELRKSVSAMRANERLTSDSIRQQHRFQMLGDLSKALSIISSSIRLQELIIYNEQSVLKERLSLLPPSSIRLEVFLSETKNFSCESIADLISELDTAHHFSQSFGGLNQDLTLLIGYLRLGGLSPLIKSDVDLINEVVIKLETIIKNLKLKGEAATFLANVAELNNAYKLSTYNFKNYVNDYCNPPEKSS